MNKIKKGVLLVNLGTPNAPDRKSVYRYLKQFLLDPRVIDYSWLPRNLLVRGIIVPFRSGSSSKLYKMLWTDKGSPLKHYGEIVTQKLQDSLGDDYHVELAMRYQNPSIPKGLDELKKMALSEIIILPLFPQYASASTGSVHQEVMSIVSKWLTIPSIKFISHYYDDPGIIEVFANNAKKMDYKSYDHFLFSFHGLPQRQLKESNPCGYCMIEKDCCKSLSEKNLHCYGSQCYQTAYKIADLLGLKEDDFTVCFQSRLGPEKWTEPFTPDIIEERQKKGDKKLLVFSPAFVADCLETIVEINHEYKEDFIEAGGEKLELVPSLNDDPIWINTLTNLVKS